MSPAVRGRGLKPEITIAVPLHEDVARRARAWIETVTFGRSHTEFASPAVRGRGLKPKS